MTRRNGNGSGNGLRAAGRAFARRVAARVADRLRPRRVILFGSYAYGRPTRDSDIDLLVVFDSGGRPGRRRLALERLIDERPMGIDFVVLTPHQIRKRLKDFDPFLEEVLSKGIILHDARR